VGPVEVGIGGSSEVLEGGGLSERDIAISDE
jgi:hypothetical protein